MTNATVVGEILALAPKPDAETIEAAVSDWLDDHPEATTTVEDGAITKAKLDSDLQDTVDDVSDLKSAITPNQDILCKLITDRSEAYEKNIPADAMTLGAKLVSIKGKSYLDGNNKAVVLVPSAITSYNSNSEQVDSLSISSVVSSVFGGEMAGVNGIADEINFAKQKAYKRCACKKISDLTVTRITTWTHPLFRLSNTGAKKPSNGFMEGYNKSTVDQTSASFPDDSYYFPPNSSYIYIRDDSYATEQSFLAAMGDRLVIYALETATETNIEISNSIKIVAGGKIRIENTGEMNLESEICYLVPKEHDTVNPDVTGDCLTLRNNLPSYYTAAPSSPDDFSDDSYMDVRIEAIPDGKQFVFFTDTHWDNGDNKKHSPSLIQYVRMRKNINTVLFGGDFINGKDTKYLARQVLGDFAYMCHAAFGHSMLPVMGNHDTNLANQVGTGTESTKYLPFSITQKVLFNNLPQTAHTQYERDGSRISGLSIDSDHQNELAAYLKLTYYYDDPVRKIRYIILNSGNPAYGHIYDIFGADDYRISMDWLYDTLRSTPSGYDVVMSMHQMHTSWTSGAMEYGSKHYYAYPSLAMGLKTKTLKELNFGGLPSNSNMLAWFPHDKYAYDFTSCNSIGKIFFVVGHAHSDYIAVITQPDNYVYRTNIAQYDGESTLDQTTPTANNGCPIPVIYVGTDAIGRKNDTVAGHEMDMTAETVTEQAFDVFTLKSGEIKMTRFGSGSDRVVYINA